MSHRTSSNRSQTVMRLFFQNRRPRPAWSGTGQNAYPILRASAPACRDADATPLHRGHAAGAAPGQRCSGLRGRRRLDLLGRARQCPIPLVRTHLIVAIVLRWVAVDHVTVVERVGNAAHLVLDREQVLAGFETDDVLPAILVLVTFLGDQPALFEPVMRAREFLGVDLQVMTVECWDRPGGLAEDQRLLVPGAELRCASFNVFL